MSIEHNILSFSNDAIILREFYGEVSVFDIIESWEMLIRNQTINGNTLGVINDLTHCNLNMNVSSFQTLIDYLSKNHLISRLKIAVVTNQPEIMVFPSLGEVFTASLSIKPFSSKELAILWVSEK